MERTRDASVISALDQLIIDAKARDEFGRKKYGTPLQPGNGRDHLRDWWEGMDGIAYAYCALHEAAGSRQYAEYEADLTELLSRPSILLIGLSQLRPDDATERALSSPTSRSMELLRKDGATVAIVERWCSFTKRRYDLLGLSTCFAVKEGETIAVQTTSYSNVSARGEKDRG